MRPTLRFRPFVATVVAVWAWLVVPPHASAQNSPEAGGQPHDWPYHLPVFGEKLAERGIRFPLPWGVGLNYAFLDQPIAIDQLQLAINDGPFHDLTDVVAFDRIDSRVQALNARLDVWLFPFLNVYALVNVAPRATTDVSLSEPFPLSAGAEQYGGGGGLGTTLAMGAWGFFGTLDVNWTRNKMQKLDAPVNTLLFAPRVGHSVFRVGKIELTAWLGAMFQRIGVDTSGKIRLSEAVGGNDSALRDQVEQWYDGLPPGRQALVRGVVEELIDTVGTDPVIHYRLDKRVAYPWNMLAGIQLELDSHWQLRCEVGFIKRTQVIVGMNYRFGFEKPSTP